MPAEIFVKSSKGDCIFIFLVMLQKHVHVGWKSDQSAFNKIRLLSHSWDMIDSEKVLKGYKFDQDFTSVLWK